jgi:hypothetical protein
VRKLERLARKMRGPLSSEGYNYLLEQQVDRVRCNFAIYMKTKEGTFEYIKTHYWRSRFFQRDRATAPAQIKIEDEINERVVRAS